MDKKVNDLLSRLKGVKNNGQGKWMACCPAHTDKSPSLSVKLHEDRILLHCFAGCGVNEILESVGMPIDSLFPDRVEPYKSTKPRYSAYELFPLLLQEAGILALALGIVTDGREISEDDWKRAVRARETIMDIKFKTGL